MGSLHELAAYWVGRFCTPDQLLAVDEATLPLCHIRRVTNGLSLCETVKLPPPDFQDQIRHLISLLAIKCHAQIGNSVIIRGPQLLLILWVGDVVERTSWYLPMKPFHHAVVST